MKNMKNYRKLKLWQKKVLSVNRKDWRNYLYIKKDAENIYVFNRITGETEFYRR